jgi:hypothetical protein
MRRLGIPLPFSDVICAEYLKSICIDAGWKAKVLVRQKLVFLDVPELGDLRDTCPVDKETTFENFIIQSPDSVEIGRRRLGRSAIVVDWEPRSRITPYALYEHEHSWFPMGSYEQLSLSTEFQCEARTGLFVFEMLTPQSFETAVVFERPRWTLLNTEKRLVKYAMKQIEAGAERPSILDNGQRLEWRILGPKMGTRYICVVFHQNGIILWKDRFKKTSLLGGMRQLVARLVPR